MNAKLSRWRLGTFTVLFVAGLSLAGCATEAVQKREALEQKIANARTRVNHEELAGYYEREATALQAKAKQHEQRAFAYGPPTDYARLQNDFIRHCHYLAGRYRDAAEANLALAKLHRRSAAEATE